MSKESLAVKYRPSDFKSVCSQKSIIDILTHQIDSGEFPPVTILSGPSGCGKTTIARIIASLINKSEKYDYREFNAALNNGTDDAEKIIAEAKQKSTISPVKIICLDEAHMLTKQAQNKFLKVFEDCPRFTVFILATTDPQNIIPTIVSRSQVFKLTRIPTKDIIERLKYICEEENKIYKDISVEDDALLFISKLADGGMRTAISLLDTCMSLSHTINTENAIKALGANDIAFNKDFLYNLYDYKFKADTEDKKKESLGYCIQMIEELYNSGKDLKLFIDQFIKFTLDVSKYIFFNHSFINTSLPNSKDLVADMDKYDFNNINTILKLFIAFKDRTKFSSDLLVALESMIVTVG